MRKIIITLTYLMLLFSMALGQYGKNKVTYDSFDWKFIQTENYDIYFYQGGEKLAEFAAPIIEEQTKRLCNLFNWRLSHRFSFIIYNSHNDFQQTNVTLSELGEGTGGFTELFKNRAVVQFTGDYHEFWHVIRHELLHVVINDLIYGGSVQNLISGRIRLNIPLWMHEGIAEYISSGWDTEADMILRDIAYNGSIPPIQYLNGYLNYKGGQSVYNYIAEKYGVEKIGEIWQQMKSFKNVDKGLKEAIGLDQEELTKDWHKWLKKKYWPDVSNRDNIDDIAIQITNEKKWNNYFNSAPAVSPNGSQLAILSNKTGYINVYIIDAFDGKIIKKLLKGQRSPETEELKLLTPKLSWSYDGKKIVLATKSGGSDALIIVDVATEKQEVIQFKELEQIYSPDFANTDYTISMVGLKDENRDIYTYNLDTKILNRMTSDIYSDYEPSWSSDDQYIYFASQRGFEEEENIKEVFIKNFTHHQTDLFYLNTGTKDIFRITQSNWNENYPVRMNKENNIIFTSDYNGISNFYLYNLDTRETKALTNVLTGVFHPSLLPDDSKLYFSGYADYGYDIYAIANPNKKTMDVSIIPPTQYAIQRQEEWKNPKIDILAGDKKLPVLNNKINMLTSGEYSSFDFSNTFFGLDTNPIEEVIHDTVSIQDTTKYIDEDGDYVVNTYKTKFTLDLVDSQAGYSTFWGLQGTTVFSFSDVLGNHRFALGTEMYIDLENSDYYVNYQYLTQKTNYSITGFHSANFYSSSFYYMWKLRNYGLDLSVSKPISRFSRMEYATTLYAVEQKYIEIPTGRALYNNNINVLLPRTAWVFDNAMWGFLNPIDGTRYRIDLTGSPKYNQKSLEFVTLDLDLRKYFKLNMDYSFAFRLSTGISEGKNAQRFFMGGESMWLNPKYNRSHNFANVEDIYFSKFVTPVRGADYYEREGTRYFLTNIEFRYPLIKYMQIGFPVPMILGGIQGVSFIDIGSAWYGKEFQPFGYNNSRGYYFEDLIGGFGFGSRIYLGYFVLKFDTAWRFDMDTISKPKYYFSLGLDF
ncbi:MAG: PD40 domain-containing protein [Candidatus Marinimicrobia bacterium]|nr:PD40 domain-containing protein [Candidatus Neomarinimicrobiota bacterium]